jgi:hypothetical protein
MGELAEALRPFAMQYSTYATNRTAQEERQHLEYTVKGGPNSTFTVERKSGCRTVKYALSYQSGDCIDVVSCTPSHSNLRPQSGANYFSHYLQVGRAELAACVQLPAVRDRGAAVPARHGCPAPREAFAVRQRVRPPTLAAANHGPDGHFLPRYLKPIIECLLHAFHFVQRHG